MLPDRDLDEAFGVLTREAPDSGRISDTAALIKRSLAPVRPLWSNRAMLAVALASFLVFAIVGAAPIGFAGFHKLDRFQKLILYIAVFGLAALTTRSVIEQMIPGLRRVVTPGVAFFSGLLALAVLTPFVFPDFDTEGLWKGSSCLKIGLERAIPAGLLVWLLVRQGLAVQPSQAALAGGTLAGLAGIAVLALYCPIRNTPHVLTWHLSVLLISTGAAVAGQKLFARRESARPR